MGSIRPTATITTAAAFYAYVLSFHSRIIFGHINNNDNKNDNIDITFLYYYTSRYPNAPSPFVSRRRRPNDDREGVRRYYTTLRPRRPPPPSQPPPLPPPSSTIKSYRHWLYSLSQRTVIQRSFFSAHDDGKYLFYSIIFALSLQGLFY